MSKTWSANQTQDMLVFQSNQAVKRAQNDLIRTNQVSYDKGRRKSMFGTVIGFLKGTTQSDKKNYNRRQTLIPQKSMDLMEATPEKNQI